MHLLLISVPFWLLLVLPASGLVIGAFFAWNNAKSSVKKTIDAQVSALSKAGQTVAANAINSIKAKI